MVKIKESELIVNNDGSIYHLSLHPKHLSDTIITVGDPGRVHAVSKYFDEVDFEMNKREFITHIGKYNNKRVTVISTGMGTGNIEVFFSEIDALANVDLKKRQVKSKFKKLKIIRIGTSGALQEDIPVDSHLVSDYASGLDSLMCFYKLKQSAFCKDISVKLQEELKLPFLPYTAKGSSKLREKFAYDMIQGNTITCPGFYGPQGREIRAPIKYKKLIEKLTGFHSDGFWFTNFEMETAAYYSMARLFGHDVISVNAILANRVTNTFSKNPNKTIDTLIQKVLERL